MKSSVILICALAVLASPFAGAVDVARSGGPYVPTPPAVVNAMLDMAGVGPRDFVVDLGSGDGRIVLAAATQRGASGVGVDIDPGLVGRANAAARAAGVAQRAHFVTQDVMKADLGRATVVTLYLLPEMMGRLRPKLLAELRPGTRIVSHDFWFDGWKPDRMIKVESPEKYDDLGTWSSELRLWIVPAAVQGAWRVERMGAGTAPARLEIRQGYQVIKGRLTLGASTAALREGRLEGERLSFAVAVQGRNERYTAVVSGDRMQGEVRDGAVVIARWSAARLP